MKTEQYNIRIIAKYRASGKTTDAIEKLSDLVSNYHKFIYISNNEDNNLRIKNELINRFGNNSIIPSCDFISAHSLRNRQKIIQYLHPDIPTIVDSLDLEDSIKFLEILEHRMMNNITIYINLEDILKFLSKNFLLESQMKDQDYYRSQYQINKSLIEILKKEVDVKTKRIDYLSNLINEIRVRCKDCGSLYLKHGYGCPFCGSGEINDE